MASSKFRLRGDYYNFSDISVVYFKNSRVIVNGCMMDLAPDYSLAQFLTEYNEWLKEEKNKLRLEDGWYSALNYSGTRYAVYIKDNSQYTPWLGNGWKDHKFQISKNDEYWLDYKKISYGKLDEWRAADIFVTALNERSPSYWEVLNDNCTA